MIEIVNLHKSFGSNYVLRGVDLKIYDGEIITILGGSGCGKTVLLKNIIGLMKPDFGEVYIDGEDITKMSNVELNRVQRKFGFVFQSCALFDSLTVFENVAFGLRWCELNKSALQSRVREALKLVNLENTEHLKPHELSGGMKKRLSIARAIAYTPKYLIYDEPTTGLDPMTTETIEDLIVNLNRELEITSIVVTHDIKCTFKVSNRIAMLYNGKIVEIGTVDEIKNSKNNVVIKFLESARL